MSFMSFVNFSQFNLDFHEFRNCLINYIILFYLMYVKYFYNFNIRQEPVVTREFDS